MAAVPRRLDPESLALIGKSPVIAFAGIGDNDGFFTMLEAAGIRFSGKQVLPITIPIPLPRSATCGRMLTDKRPCW